MKPKTASGSDDREPEADFGIIRLALVVSSVVVALMLGWNGIARQHHAEQLRQQQYSINKAELRRYGAILRCAGGGSFFDDQPPRQTTTIVPAPDERGPGFDFGQVDRIVETQECKLDTDPQNVWAATHPVIAPPVHAP